MTDRREHPLSTADLAGAERPPEQSRIEARAEPLPATGARGATRIAARRRDDAEGRRPGPGRCPRTADGSDAAVPDRRERAASALAGRKSRPASSTSPARRRAGGWLVAEMMQRLAQVFADERGKLEEQWSQGDDISTEDLRVAFRRYRSFFDRLLSV